MKSKEAGKGKKKEKKKKKKKKIRCIKKIRQNREGSGRRGVDRGDVETWRCGRCEKGARGGIAKKVGR